MASNDRHAEILGLLATRGRVSAGDLASRFDVTVETIRRDLAVLDRAGARRKVHGGAVPAPVLAVPETAVAAADTEVLTA